MWLVWLGEQLLRAIYAFLDAVIPPPMRVFDLAFTGFAQAEVIRTLCALGVAEALNGGPRTAEELATELGKCIGSTASDPSEGVPPRMILTTCASDPSFTDLMYLRRPWRMDRCNHPIIQDYMFIGSLKQLMHHTHGF